MPDKGNVEQRNYWDGDAGHHWVAEADRYDAMNRRYGELAVDALSPATGEAILDVGCGNGAVTLEVARRVGAGGAVLGLDLSGPMLEVARGRAADAGFDQVRFEQGDAQVHPLPAASFDGVVSRFGVMFFNDPVAAFANLAQATKRGGRLAFACWQDLLANEWLMVPAGAALQHVPFPELGEPGAPGPFSLADPERVREVLDKAGWTGVALADAHEPMRMGSSADDVVSFLKGTDMAATLLADAPVDVVEAAWAAVCEVLEERVGPEGLVLSGKVWIVTARRG
jgi:SAM-dependent methyltransferase